MPLTIPQATFNGHDGSILSMARCTESLIVVSGSSDHSDGLGYIPDIRGF
jgi:hypothetical protein